MSQPVLQDHVAGSKPDHAGSYVAFSTAVWLGIGILALLLVFSREIRAAIDVWDASTAYSHCYLVLPMTAYLLWDRRELLKNVQTAPEIGFAVAAVPLTFLWLVAERLGIMEGRQLVFIASVELLCVTVLGRRMYWQLCGPLLFLCFLVPFGAFLTPALQEFTAAFSIFGLDLLGIPNFSDKFTIETPAGIFFVAEACAGLRFLIAAIAFGVFYSLLTYTSVTRRALFILACIVVPVIANGFRALGIVVLGQVLGSAEAAAADHIIYGWVFFSVVMLLLIAGGQLFRENEQPIAEDSPAVSALPRRSPSWRVVSVILLLSIGPAAARVIDLNAVVPPMPRVPTIVAPPGCALVPGTDGDTSNRQLVTVVCSGYRFEVSVQAFAARSTSTAMISERRRVTQEIGAENSVVSHVEMPDAAGSWTLVQTTDPNRLTAYAGWVDGAPLQSNMAGRIAQARDSLFGASYAPALITITIAEPANSPPAKRRETLETLTGLLLAQPKLNSNVAALTSLRGR